MQEQELLTCSCIMIKAHPKASGKLHLWGPRHRIQDWSEPSSLSSGLMFLPSSSLPRPKSPVPGLTTARLQCATGKAVEGSMRISAVESIPKLCGFVCLLWCWELTLGPHTYQASTLPLGIHHLSISSSLGLKKKKKLISRLGFIHSLGLLL